MSVLGANASRSVISEDGVLSEEADPSKLSRARTYADATNWRIAGKPPRKYVKKIGKAENTAIQMVKYLKAVKVFATRFAPATTENDIVGLFTDSGDIECEKLNSRYPEKYSSFEVTMRAEDPSAILNENNWPRGTYFRRFREPRRNPSRTMSNGADANLHPNRVTTNVFNSQRVGNNNGTQNNNV